MKYLSTDANVSNDGLYRYWLARRLSMGERSVAFIGFNPSTADAMRDDPTIRKCVGFAARWGFDWLYMLNLYAWRATNPKTILGMQRGLEAQAIGFENSDHVKRLTGRCELIVAAWGANRLSQGAKRMATAILSDQRTHVLRWTASGNPEHPLYVPYAVTPLPGSLRERTLA